MQLVLNQKEIYLILYRATNKINGKFYLGISSRDLNKRKNEHISRRNTGKSLISKAIKKYGQDAFEWDVLYQSDDEIDIKTIEREMISALKPPYNLSEGGEGMIGYTFSERTKKIFSDKYKGKKRPPEIGKKISKGLTGRIRTEESKLKQSNSRKGFVVSEQTRLKISESMKKLKRG